MAIQRRLSAIVAYVMVFEGGFAKNEEDKAASYM